MYDALITKAERIKCGRNRSVVAAAAVGGISQLWSYANSASECEISPDKRRKRGERGVGAAPHRGRGVKIKIARESWVGVASEARASCSGEHVVPCLPPCFSVTVCLKVCSFSRLVGFIFIPPPQHSRPLLLSTSTSTSPPCASCSDVPRDCRQPGRGHYGEGGRSSGRACAGKCARVRACPVRLF